jgi:hypothetical protein
VGCGVVPPGIAMSARKPGYIRRDFRWVWRSVHRATCFRHTHPQLPVAPTISGGCGGCGVVPPGIATFAREPGCRSRFQVGVAVRPPRHLFLSGPLVIVGGSDDFRWGCGARRRSTWNCYVRSRARVSVAISGGCGGPSTAPPVFVTSTHYCGWLRRFQVGVWATASFHLELLRSLASPGIRRDFRWVWRSVHRGTCFCQVHSQLQVAATISGECAGFGVVPPRIAASARKPGVYVAISGGCVARAIAPPVLSRPLAIAGGSDDFRWVCGVRRRSTQNCCVPSQAWVYAAISGGCGSGHRATCFRHTHPQLPVAHTIPGGAAAEPQATTPLAGRLRASYPG